MGKTGPSTSLRRTEDDRQLIVFVRRTVRGARVRARTPRDHAADHRITRSALAIMKLPANSSVFAIV